jgi:osmotically-inducible protein OsmY
MAARRVKGVVAVAQEIKVQLPFERERGDDQIAEAVLDRLAWDVSVPSNSVQVTVDQGWVTLTGIVERHFQRQAAEENVRRLQGVVGVSNQIAIKPQVNTANISDDISCALHRSWFPDPDAITVTAQGGKVRLTGNVHSWHARDVAGQTAWAPRARPRSRIFSRSSEQGQPETVAALERKRTCRIISTPSSASITPRPWSSSSTRAA